VSSLWEANMDLLKTPSEFDITDRKWNIYSRTMPLPPHYAGKRAKIINSTVTEGSIINGEVNNSIISAGVTIEKGARVINSVLMSGVKVGKNAIIKKAVIGENAIISENTQIGTITDKNNKYASNFCTNDIVLIEEGVKTKKNQIIPTGSMVEKE
ncbi:MAG: glucose-1-phosphate adenylyltransferase, partial [Clostridia bacterium]|nr:glucose-1-phosphate adenylyltransferase [Clostridia bacterium]